MNSPIGNHSIGVVVIGRNEGERLRNCLTSLGLGTASHEVASTDTPIGSTRMPILYVDSGSTDGSIEMAKGMGANVVELDLASPFTAARARNAGLEQLVALAPEILLVQFIDGDCVVDAGWLDAASQFLEEHPKYACVCGRRRERFPEASLFNRLCDLEWNTPIGDALACGGDALMRIEAVRQVGGFDASVIAGEEPELCVRLRQRGWSIRRLDAEMTLHDAAMHHGSQWWRRTVRGGYAYALGSSMHGAPPERHWVSETRSIWFWGIALPLFILIFAWPSYGATLLLLVGYPILGVRVYRYMRGRGVSPRDSRLYALFCVLAKFPQGQGVLRFWWGKWRAKPSAIIEYKKPA